MNTDMVTTLSEPPVSIATTSDMDRTIHAVVMGFSDDPVMRWLYPEPHQYFSAFPDFVRAFAGRAFERGTAYRVNGYSGAALWLPPGVQPDVDEVTAVLQRSVSAKVQDELHSLLEQSEKYHPSEPHWYLPLIGVDPAWRRRGYGAALMEHALAMCDREGNMAYLESSNPENQSLYRRHGFELLGEIRAGSAPPIYPMLRQPQ
jgi:ribosomal protein S18 acetylase RimI-like enzyme